MRRDPIDYGWEFVAWAFQDKTILCLGPYVAPWQTAKSRLPDPTCWNEPAGIKMAWVENVRDRASDDEAPFPHPVDALVDIRRPDDRVSREVVRLPEQTRARLTSVRRPFSTDMRPDWFPRTAISLEQLLRPPKDAPHSVLPGFPHPAGSDFEPLPVVAPLDLEPLHGVYTTYLPTAGSHDWRTVEVMTTERDRQLLCIRDAGRWRCAARFDLDPGSYHLQGWYGVIPLDDTHYVALRHSIEDGGNGTGSGAGGGAWMEVFERREDRLVFRGSLRIGEMAWTTFMRFENTPRRHHARRVVRYYHPVQAAGRGCVRLGIAERQAAWADWGFYRVGAVDRRATRELLPVYEVTELPRSPGSLVQEPSTKAGVHQAREPGDLDSPLPVPDLAGLYRFTEDHGWVRVSDPDTCAP